MERWKDIEGYEGRYEVSTYGRVRNKSTGHIRKLQTTNKGYKRLTLRRNGSYETLLIHRIVAGAFIPNPHGYDLVLHGDDVHYNNVVTNLRWGTHSDNNYDRVVNGRHHARNKTHCNSGHEFTENNTYVDKNKRRTCRKCKSESSSNKRLRGLPVVSPLHGRTTGYFGYGCRCYKCKQAASIFSKKKYLETKEKAK